MEAPQVPMPLAEVPPRSLTAWLIQRSKAQDAMSILQEIDAAWSLYDNGPALDHADRPAFISEVATRSVGTEELVCFLTVTEGEAAGSPPRVTVVSGLRKFVASFGVLTPQNGRTFGFLGESPDLGLQLAPMVRAPEQLSHLFEQHAYAVPTDVAIAAAYPEPVVPGGAVDQSLMEGPDLALAIEAQTAVILPRLMFVPKAWAIYFMHGLSPYAAYKMGKALVEQLPAMFRPHLELFVKWLAITCTRVGLAGENPRSQLQSDWELVPAASMAKHAGMRSRSWRKPELKPRRPQWRKC
jgi:hypothetical protein